MSKKTSAWVRLFDDLLALLYPRLCLACSADLPPYSSQICVRCRLKLPETEFHLLPENAFTDRFWGRIDLQAGAAMLYFRRKGMTQNLMHQLKYQGKKEIGLELGRLYGYQLRDSACFKGLDGVLAVPLHPRKERRRGFNQSDWFARGLAEGLGIPHLKGALIRVVDTDSQTKKSRFERVENMQEAFRAPKPEFLQGKHVLLADDVLTTGATLEACALKLLEIQGVKISMATIAIAD
jgi:ComF family protein